MQKAKDATEHLLQEYIITDQLPQRGTTLSLTDLLTRTGKGKYLAIMAYLRQTPQMDKVLAELRRKVMVRHQIATTLGYGPRFLHSTGQLHKGGPNNGLFLQITARHRTDLPIPGRLYTFGVIADAQALGDLEALQTLGRHVTRIHFSQGDEETISEMIKQLE